MSDHQLNQLIDQLQSGYYRTGRGEVKKMTPYRLHSTSLKVRAESAKRGRVVYRSNRPARATETGYEPR